MFLLKIKNYLFCLIVSLSSLIVIIPLFLVTQLVFSKGISSLNWNFFFEIPTPIGELGGGMKHAIIGTFYLVLIGALISVPIGIICAVFLSEYRKSKF